MRKVLNSLFWVTAVTFLLTSCKENKQKNLTQTWRVADIRISAEIPDEMKAYFEESARLVKEYMRLTFKADGTCTRSFLGSTATEEWQANKEFTELTVTDENGRTKNYQIITLTKDSFIYKSADQNSDTVVFVMLPSDTLTNNPMFRNAPAPQGEPSANGK